MGMVLKKLVFYPGTNMEEEDEAALFQNVTQEAGILDKFTPQEGENLTNLEMDLGPRIVWDLLFGSMLFVAVLGNLIVLWIVTGKDTVFRDNAKYSQSWF